jgi:hypothetical protein
MTLHSIFDEKRKMRIREAVRNRDTDFFRSKKEQTKQPDFQQLSEPYRLLFEGIVQDDVRKAAKAISLGVELNTRLGVSPGWEGMRPEEIENSSKNAWQNNEVVQLVPPLTLAETLGREEIAELIRQHGGRK